MPNPHMGPDWPHRFKTDREDPLTQHLQLKIGREMESRLKAMGQQKNDFIRAAIATALDGPTKYSIRYQWYNNPPEWQSVMATSKEEAIERVLELNSDINGKRPKLLKAIISPEWLDPNYPRC